MDDAALISFGDLLKAARRRCHVTQRFLAGQVGVHVNTIGAWERGDYLPATRGLVLELARRLKLQAAEARQLLEASLTALTRHWTVPFPRNPCFTGREALLEALHTRLARAGQPGDVPQVYALSGLGGSGKTQLALEYAYRFARDYQAVFWLAADSPERLIASLGQIAEALGLPERQEADQPRLVAAVRRWMSTHREWLLILDNVEDLPLLEAVLPPTCSGALLLTTRLQALGALAERLEVPPLSQEEGVRLLFRRAQRPLPEALDQLPPVGQVHSTEMAAAQEVVDLLGGLPLALDQAGGYLEETGASIAAYLQQYAHQRKQLLARRGAAGGAHPDSVTTTLLLGVAQVQQSHPAAAALLSCCAFLHPEAIPEELFLAGASHLGPVLGPVAADPAELDLALATLRRFSLISRHPERQTLALHRLVQAVLLDHLEEDMRRAWRERVVRLVNAAFPAVEFATWAQAERCLPHALACLPLLSDLNSGLPEATELLYKAGCYLFQRGRYPEAELRLGQAVTRAEAEHHPEHPALIPLLIQQADITYYQGHFVQAEALLRRVLALCEAHLGATHLQTAKTLDILAGVYLDQGQYGQAEPLYQRVLTIREQQVGPDHPETASVLNDLAILYKMQGRYAQAEPFYQRALAICEQQVGPEHPDTAMILNNLAMLYIDQGRYAQAEPLLQRALAIKERQLGPDHPDLAFDLNNLALLSYRTGQYTQAEPLLQRALRICEQQVGLERPQTAIVLYQMARHAHAQSQYAQAERLYQRALRIQEQHVGPAHPQTAATLAGLAQLFQQQGAIKQASDFYARALAISERQLGPQHPETRRLRHEARALTTQSAVPALPSPLAGEAQAPAPASATRTISVAAQRSNGKPGQRAYTRTIQTRLVSFVCAWCQTRVSQQRYPGPQPRYCSADCARAADREPSRARKRRHRERQQQARAATHERAAHPDR